MIKPGKAFAGHGEACKVPDEVISSAIVTGQVGNGTIDAWKEMFDNTIANLLKGHESEHALSAL